MLNRFNHFIEKWMFLVTPCCLALGVLFPSVAGLGVPYVPPCFRVYDLHWRTEVRLS